MKRSAGIVYQVDALKAVSARSGAFWGVLIDGLHDDDDTEGGVEAVRGSASPCVVMGRRHAGAVGCSFQNMGGCMIRGRRRDPDDDAGDGEICLLEEIGMPKNF